MRSKYVSPPTLPSPPSVPSNSNSSNEEDDTERFDMRPLRSNSLYGLTIPTATVTGLPYKRKKSNVFTLTADNDHLMEANRRPTNPFITHIHTSSTGVGQVPSTQTKFISPYDRRQLRSKSDVSTEPKSHYMSKSLSLVQSQHNSLDNSLVPKHRRSSDSNLNRKSLCRREWGELSGIHIGKPENAVLNGDIPGLNTQLSPDDPKAVTIYQHYYPEGHWGWVLTVCVCLAYLFTCALTPSSGFFIVDTITYFELEDGVFGAGMRVGLRMTFQVLGWLKSQEMVCFQEF